jgi:prevent-host-death family protein
MQTIVGSYAAKVHLPALLKRVEEGEEFLITRHGAPVAVLSSASRTLAQRAEVRKTIQAMIESRKGCRLDGLSIREMIDEGRP